MNSAVRNTFLACLGLSVVLLAVLVYRAYVVIQPCRHSLKKIDASNKVPLTAEQIARFQKALRFETVSYTLTEQNVSELTSYVNYVRSEFRDIESQPYVTLTLINNLSMLYEIRGSERHLKPYMLAAHSDVVPSNAQSDQWTHAPFAADIEDGFVYARGSLDDKSSMFAHLEAVRALLARHGRPRRTIYLAYGHDEEVNGYRGAALIAQHLAKLGVELEFVMDEGTMIVEGFIPELSKAIALISVAEKGYLSVKFSANTSGGHSSMPKREHSAVARLVDAAHKINGNQVPSMLGLGSEKHLFEQLGTHFGFLKRLVLTNMWIFKPFVERPAYGEFVVNHRIHSAQSCADILKHDLEIIDDNRIHHEVLACEEPSHISSADSLGYKMIEHATLQVYPDSIPLPSILLALTDSRFYDKLTKDIYKYLPVQLRNEDLRRYHGIDERLSLKSYENLINFFLVLMENTDRADLENENNTHSEL